MLHQQDGWHLYHWHNVPGRWWYAWDTQRHELSLHSQEGTLAWSQFQCRQHFVAQVKMARSVRNSQISMMHIDRQCCVTCFGIVRLCPNPLLVVVYEKIHSTWQMPIHLLLVSHLMFIIILCTLCANLPSMNALDNRQKSGKQRNSNVDNDLTRSEISLQARTLGSRSIIIVL